MNTKAQTNNSKKFSIEVMPRTAKKVDNFKRILPEKTTVYVAHLEDTPVEEMFATCKRLILKKWFQCLISQQELLRMKVSLKIG